VKFPEQYRVPMFGTAYASKAGDTFGIFVVQKNKECGRLNELRVIANDGTLTDWEHVSVSTDKRTVCATWYEMCFIKDLFWDSTECVVQFHPAASHYINTHPGCLHLWRHTKGFPTPPTICV